MSGTNEVKLAIAVVSETVSVPKAPSVPEAPELESGPDVCLWVRVILLFPLLV